ncbi:hypothetical protein EON80_02005 [bacterium]|nr:MAG: hypothetical protein EON80_02005 [bacterium]
MEISTLPLLRAKADHTSLYFHQLHALLNAGVGLSFALDTLSEQGPNRGLRQASAEMSRRVSDGNSWAKEMRKYPNLFSRMTIAIIESAEATGFLDKACQMLSEDGEREHQIYQTIKQETWYPKLLLFFSTVIFALPITLSLGFATVTLEMKHQVWILAAIWLPWLVGSYFWPLLPPDSQLRWKIDEMRLKIPIAGKTVRGFATAKFCRFLSISYAAGMSFPQGVALASAACGNVVLAEKLRSTIPALQAGQQLSDVLIATGELPSTVLPLLRTGEATGDLDVQLQTAARFLEMDAGTALKQAVTAFNVLMLVLVCVKIGTQVVQYYLRMYGVL